MSTRLLVGAVVAVVVLVSLLNINVVAGSSSNDRFKSNNGGRHHQQQQDQQRNRTRRRIKESSRGRDGFFDILSSSGGGGGVGGEGEEEGNTHFFRQQRQRTYFNSQEWYRHYFVGEDETAATSSSADTGTTAKGNKYQTDDNGGGSSGNSGNSRRNLNFEHLYLQQTNSTSSTTTRRATATTSDGRPLPTYYECAQRVKQTLLKNGGGGSRTSSSASYYYDTGIPPIISMNGNSNGNMLNVSMVLELYHISELDVRVGTLELFLWMYFWWIDPRLSLTSSSVASSSATTTDDTTTENENDNDDMIKLCYDYNILSVDSSIPVRASYDVQTSDIWVPDIDLYNKANGLYDMDESMAEIFPTNGVVLWKRNGRIKALCSFVGLGNIPYDTLGCRLIFGGWTSQSNIQINLVNTTYWQPGPKDSNNVVLLLTTTPSMTTMEISEDGQQQQQQVHNDDATNADDNGDDSESLRQQQIEMMRQRQNPNQSKQLGFVYGALNPQNYVEYKLLPSMTTTGYGLVDILNKGEIRKNVVYYDMYFSRSTSYYVLKIIVPNILFAFLSFGVFLLDLRVGERLSYGIAVLLVNVASDITTQTKLPVTEERLWIDVLIIGSFYWMLVGLIESVIMGFLFFYYDDDVDSDKNKSSSNNNKNSNTVSRSNNEERSKSLPTITENDDDDDDDDDGGEGTNGTAKVDGKGKNDPPETAARENVIETRNNSGRIQGQHPSRRPTTTTTTSTTISRSTARRQSSFATLTKVLREKPKTKLKIIRSIDMFFFAAIPTSYVAFLVIMFVTRNHSMWNTGEFPF